MKLSLTAQCLLGLGIGILAGVVLPGSVPDATGPLLAGSDIVTRIWTNALRLVVTPLVVAQLFTAISAHRGARGEMARLGAVISVVFGALLVVSALVAMAVTSGLLTLPVFQNLSLDRPLPAPAPTGGTEAYSLIDELVPPNLFAAASADSLLALMLFAVVFAVAARRLAPELQHALDTAARAVRDAMFVLIEWLILLAPLGLLAFGLRTAATSGWAAGEILIAFTVIAMVVFSACTLALYPLAALFGGVPLARFAKALIPAQAIAVGTRSSLATLPALLREAELTLRLPGKLAALVIPLGGAVLKLSRAASHAAKLLFLAAVLGLSLEPGKVVVFIATIILLSPTTQGIPRVMAAGRSLPAYIAIGIAPEYYFLLGSTTALTDVVQTLLNSTAYLTAAVLVARFAQRKARAPAVAEPAGAPPPAGVPLSEEPGLRP